MTDQNVKMKTSSIPKQPEQVDQNRADSFQTNSKAAESAKITAGDAFRPGDAKSNHWKAMNSGGVKSSAVPGLPDENILGAIGEFCRDANNKPRGYYQTYKNDFRPKSRFDQLRLFYESPDITKLSDLKQNLPSVPRFDKMYRMVKDFGYIKRYYKNRLGLIKDLIAHSEDEIKKTDNPEVIKARMEFIDLLRRKETFTKEQLSEAERTSRLRKST